MMKDKFIHAFMDCAERFAQLSTATRAKVGAIIVKDNRIISIGVFYTFVDIGHIPLRTAVYNFSPDNDAVQHWCAIISESTSLFGR